MGEIDAPRLHMTVVGYALYQTGRFFYPSERGVGTAAKSIGASGFRDGDTVTVKVDLDANTISFQKNGADNGAPQDIRHGSYFFACVPNQTCGAMTIVGRR